MPLLVRVTLPPLRQRRHTLATRALGGRLTVAAVRSEVVEVAFSLFGVDLRCSTSISVLLFITRHYLIVRIFLRYKSANSDDVPWMTGAEYKCFN